MTSRIRFSHALNLDCLIKYEWKPVGCSIETEILQTALTLFRANMVYLAEAGKKSIQIE